jgi:hypothetical protein
VPNPSFESYSTCPDFSGQLNYLDNWNNVNLVYGNFNYATPDFYHTCSSASLATLPNNNFATLNAFDGNAVAALVIYNYDLVDFREYISTQLTQPLNQENSYTIKFRLTGGTNQDYRFNSHNFGIVFSESPLSQATWEIINAVPQIELDTLLNTPQWAEYSFNYTPNKAYSYITIGSFRHDTDINAVNSASSVNKYSYVFIDAIEIKSTNTGIKSIINSNLIVNYEQGKLFIANPENELLNKIIITDSQGRIIQSESLGFSNSKVIELKENVSTGIYLATIYSDSNVSTLKFIVTK